jgi:hypothetical protein
MAASPMPPPQKSSSNVIWWVLGIIGACITLVIIAGLVVVSVLVHRVRVSTKNNNVEIQTPVGSLKVNQDNEHTTGLPVYPGATLEKSRGVSFDVESNGKSAGLAIEKYTSDDSRETVQQWYASKLGAEFKLKVANQGGNDQIQGLPVDVKTTDVAFVDDRGNGARVVALARHGDGTEITLVRAGKKEPQ